METNLMIFAFSKIISKKKNVEMRVIHNRNNMGASYARNQGVSFARGEYLLFLDSDVVFKSVYAIQCMCDFLSKNQEYAAAGGEIGGDLTSPSKFYLFFLDEQFLTEEREIALDEVDSCEVYDVDYVTTACCMMRMSDFVEVGGFDERFFYLAEDKDIGHQLSLMDKKNCVSPSFAAFHMQKTGDWTVSYKESRKHDNMFRLIKEKNKYVLFNCRKQYISLLFSNIRDVTKKRPTIDSSLQLALNLLLVPFCLLYMLSPGKRKNSFL